MTEKQEVVSILSTAASGFLGRKNVSAMAELLYDAGLWSLMPPVVPGPRCSYLTNEGAYALRALS